MALLFQEERDLNLLIDNSWLFLFHGVEGSNQRRNSDCFNLTSGPAKLIWYECEIFCWYETIRWAPGGPSPPTRANCQPDRPLLLVSRPALLASDWRRECHGPECRTGVGIIFRCCDDQLYSSRHTVNTSHTDHYPRTNVLRSVKTR